MSLITLRKVNSHLTLVSKGLHQASEEGVFWQPAINEVVFGSVLHLHEMLRAPECDDCASPTMVLYLWLQHWMKQLNQETIPVIFLMHKTMVMSDHKTSYQVSTERK